MIERIYDEAAQGKSQRKITLGLTADGWTGARGGPVRVSTVGKILRNPVYLGWQIVSVRGRPQIYGLPRSGRPAPAPDQDRAGCPRRGLRLRPRGRLRRPGAPHRGPAERRCRPVRADRPGGEGDAGRCRAGCRGVRGRRVHGRDRAAGAHLRSHERHRPGHGIPEQGRAVEAASIRSHTRATGSRRPHLPSQPVR
ncbi:recombinase family protein [Kitasatospora sp. NPDC087861]|uniref:recombinase family protein n=1 Tax=Kitasatospora sp. NPDC087861 TaxID=3364070 RepID=UPI0038224F39